MIVTCDTCQHEYQAEANFLTRTAFDKGADIIEHALRCPKCETVTHTHYVNPAIERRQALVQITAKHHQERRTETTWNRYRQAKADLEREFNLLNPKKVPA